MRDSGGSFQIRSLKLSCYSGKKKKKKALTNHNGASHPSPNARYLCPPLSVLPNHVRTIKAQTQTRQSAAAGEVAAALNPSWEEAARICESASERLPSRRPAETCPELALLQFPLFGVRP